jgi:hypothetical protein
LSESFRSKWMDPDFRPSPKHGLFCRICMRDLKPSQKRRVVMFCENHFEAVHQNDWDKAKATGGVWNVEPVGMDCAKRLGLEWSREV